MLAQRAKALSSTLFSARVLPLKKWPVYGAGMLNITRMSSNVACDQVVPALTTSEISALEKLLMSSGKSSDSGLEPTGEPGPTDGAGSVSTGAATEKVEGNLTNNDEEVLEVSMETLTPRQTVEWLDKHIVGQPDAKRAVAIALRNRYRRLKIDPELRPEVVPKNILMIGPTGCGKTEIARRLAKLAKAPFIKVEATKFTEVGFHGRDVDQIIRDLVDISITMTKNQHSEKLRSEARALAEKEVVQTLMSHQEYAKGTADWQGMLQSGELDQTTITIHVPSESMSDAGAAFQFPQLGEAVTKIMQGMNKGKNEPKKVTVKEALPILEELSLQKLLKKVDLQKEAIKSVEESGIVFIDEIDKICTRQGDYRSADASSEGVQRDLLPLIEGCSISTRFGTVNTDYILFVASGAFHHCKPSDLLAELQGRLPIRVELQGLTENDLYRILTEPVANLMRQYTEMLNVEKVQLKFDEEAIREMARVASDVNATVENIGARRLQTIMERVLEEISFEAPDYEEGTVITVTKDMVSEKVSDMLVQSDLSKYIL